MVQPMLGNELRESAKTGAARLKETVRDADYGSLLSRMKLAFGFLSRHIKNIALLDPLGLGAQEKVRVPFLMTQVIDRNQPCEFLPDTGKALCQYEGQLIVNGRALPMVRLQGEDGHAVDMGHRHLYAINTNQQPEAFKLLGLDPKKYKNIRLIVACSGSIVLPPPEGKDLRLMRVVRNAELSPETRRIKREDTGQTLWIPTLLVAVPFNICAGLINVALMAPHALFHGVKRLAGAAAKRVERKVEHIKVAQERGTVSDLGTHRHWLLLGAMCRAVDRTFALASCALGTIRIWTTCLLKSVPLLANALCNWSSAQLTIAKCYMNDTAARVDEMWAEFQEENRSVAQFYTGTEAKKSPRDSASKDGNTPHHGRVSSASVQLQERFGEELSPILREKLRDGASNKRLWYEARGCGRDLFDFGVCISYGTAKQGIEEFADTVKRQREDKSGFVGRV